MIFFPELDVFLPFCLNSYFYFNFNPSKLRTSTLRIRACVVDRVRDMPRRVKCVLFGRGTVVRLGLL